MFTAIATTITMTAPMMYHLYGGVGVCGRRVFLFFDERLRVEEERDFVLRVVEKKLVLSEFFECQFCMGTIGVVTNCGFGAARVFELLKERVEVEGVFDVFKNSLNADRLYMRDDLGLQVGCL
ncbi:MAG: hypothetical protein LBH62_00365 [Nitrososphaerota archaeon]|jgi:hypothetical protein|nr:hypothetical protein [Nitrososphaerota archaeon]